MGPPLLSMNGDPHFRPITLTGEWLRCEVWVPVLDDEDNAQVWKWWANVDHTDVKDGNQGARDYIMRGLHGRFFDLLAPLSYQNLMHRAREHFEGVDFTSYLPKEMPQPVTWRIQ